MSLIAVGDVHGCAHTLEALLSQLEIGPDDELVFVGDYIDRGPHSREVIELLLNLKQDVSCTFLRGNHEAMMLGYLDRAEYELWRFNGGASTLSSYLTAERQVEIPDEHVAFLRATESYRDTPEFFFVHGGIPPELTVAEAIARCDDETFLWERSHFESSNRAWEKVVVCGHTPMTEPLCDERLISIDTGCVYYTRPGMGRLAAVRLPEREFTFAAYAE